MAAMWLPVARWPMANGSWPRLAAEEKALSIWLKAGSSAG